MERKEDTPVRKTRRKYEEKNKEKRKQSSGNFGTMIPRTLYDEINAFLEENGITKGKVGVLFFLPTVNGFIVAAEGIVFL